MWHCIKLYMNEEDSLYNNIGQLGSMLPRSLAQLNFNLLNVSSTNPQVTEATQLSVLQFMRLLCLGHHKKLQEYMRSQRESFNLNVEYNYKNIGGNRYASIHVCM